jgi:hypothetical protein
MSEEKEQRGCSKFCVKLGKNGVESLKIFKKNAYGENALSRTTVFVWHKWFKKGRESTDDDHCFLRHQRNCAS